MHFILFSNFANKKSSKIKLFKHEVMKKMKYGDTIRNRVYIQLTNK